MNIIVIANGSTGDDTLCSTIRNHIRRVNVGIAVVAPALNSRLRYWLSDEDGARRDAEARLQLCVGRLISSGFSTNRRVGDADPLQAIADSIACAPADVLVITAPRPERPQYLAKNLADRARRQFGLPVLCIPLEHESSPRLAA
jgi:hypothetical protein